MHGDGGVQQATADAGHHRRTGASAAGQGFASAALVHAQGNFLTVEHLHEAGVHPLRKAGVLFDLRAVRGHRRGVDVVHYLHGVRVAHRHHGDTQFSAVRQR